MAKGIYSVAVTSDAVRTGFKNIAALLTVSRKRKVTQEECLEMALGLLKKDLREELKDVSILVRLED